MIGQLTNSHRVISLPNEGLPLSRIFRGTTQAPEENHTHSDLSYAQSKYSRAEHQGCRHQNFMHITVKSAMPAQTMPGGGCGILSARLRHHGGDLC